MKISLLFYKAGGFFYFKVSSNHFIKKTICRQNTKTPNPAKCFGEFWRLCVLVAKKNEGFKQLLHTRNE
jgi:hypothetical protein